jgi:predicted RNase H-like HicB family nuclease
MPAAMSPNEKREALKISYGGNHKVDATLMVVDFKDGHYHIAFTPSLNLSAYGDNKEQAMERMDEVLGDYFENLLSLKDPNVNVKKIYVSVIGIVVEQKAILNKVY